MPTLAVALLQALKDHGAREIFGIPGDFVLPLFKVIEESAHPAAPHAQPRAGGRLRGRRGGALSRGARRRGRHLRRGRLQPREFDRGRLCGALAGRGDLGCARRARALRRLPAAPSGAHDRHPVAIFSEVTCDQAVLNDPATAPAEIARVLRSARERSLPVYIEFPRDMVAAQVERGAGAGAPRRRSGALAECADEIIARLARPSRRSSSSTWRSAGTASRTTSPRSPAS